LIGSPWRLKPGLGFANYQVLRRSAVSLLNADCGADPIITQGQATVIAVSGMLLYTQHSEQPIPRIVRAALGVGNLVLELDRRTLARTGHSVEYQDEITNPKGASIRTDVFLDPAYAHISAVLYSTADWVNLPKEPGTELILIHNHQATTPLPRGWLPVGDEYWWEDNAIRSEWHSGHN
jgi:hypothetical protein